tara:strand:- start:1572 stop:2009 length:438 start_codon:yes stop_codon:yes gene_type:complete
MKTISYLLTPLSIIIASLIIIIFSSKAENQAVGHNSAGELRYGYIDNPSQKIVLKEGEAVVILGSNRNQTIYDDVLILVETPIGKVYEVSFLDLNASYARLSKEENRSYGFGMSSTSEESRTLTGPITIKLNKEFYLAYKILKEN